MLFWQRYLVWLDLSHAAGEANHVNYLSHNKASLHIRFVSIDYKCTLSDEKTKVFRFGLPGSLQPVHIMAQTSSGLQLKAAGGSNT